MSDLVFSRKQHKKNKFFTILEKFNSTTFKAIYNHRDEDSIEIIRVKIASSVLAFLSSFISSWFDLIIFVFPLPLTS